MVRVGLKQTLAEELSDVDFGEASSSPETIQRLHAQTWDVIVLDIQMPGPSGLEVLKEVKQNFPRLPVLVLSSVPEDQLAARVLKAGAAGYLNKQSAPEELVKAVRKVMAGGHYVSAALGEKLAADLGRSRNRAHHETLSDREYQVFRLMLGGKSLKETAAELSVSPKTVSTYRTRIFEKLRVKNDIELARYAMEHGLGEFRPPNPPPQG
ncbi:LuxR family two component transcriptional regulator [Chthoniobacter flavus]|nr:LuxR family two component transcriptional regulator [Chthoniobacter flavus]